MKASEHFLEALMIRRQLKQEYSIGRNEGPLAEFLREHDLWEQAENHLQEAASTAEQESDIHLAAEASAELALHYLDVHLSDEAFLQFESALTHLVHTPDEKLEAKIHTNLANLYRTQGHMTEAHEHSLLALDQFRKLGNRRNEVIVMGNLYAILIELHRPEEALPYLLQVIEYYRESKDRVREGVALGDYATVLQLLGRYEEARAAFLSAISIAHETNDRPAEGIAIGTYAIFLLDRGAYEESYQLFQSALNIHVATGDERFQGITLGNLANLINMHGDVYAAQAYYLQSLELHRRTGDRLSEAIVLAGLADNLHNQKRYTESREHYNHALDIIRNIGDEVLEGTIACEIGELETDLGNYSDAHHYFEHGCDILRMAGDLQQRHLQLCHYSELCLLSGKSELAEELFSEADELANDKLPPVDMILDHVLRSQFALASPSSNSKQHNAVKGSLTAALAEYRVAAGLIQRYRVSPNTSRTRSFSRLRQRLQQFNLPDHEISQPNHW